MRYLIPIIWAFTAIPVVGQDGSSSHRNEWKAGEPVPTEKMTEMQATGATGCVVPHGHTFSRATFSQVLNAWDVGFIDLQGCPIDDRMCDEIAGLHSLEELVLVGTWITDDGLKRLCRLKNLRVLDLRGTQISDDGITSLIRINRLREVDLRGTKVTRDGAARLRAHRPNLLVLSDHELRVTLQAIAGPLMWRSSTTHAQLSENLAIRLSSKVVAFTDDPPDQRGDQ